MSVRPNGIPAPAVRRLSLYLRQLESLAEKGRETVSSRELGKTLGLTDAQVRKDLAYFGQFGQPGIGYRVDEVVRRVRHILGTDQTWNTALVGFGNLGRALTAYRGFAAKGFKLVAVFDAAADKLGKPVRHLDDLKIQPISELAATVTAARIRLGILAVPAEAAQTVADLLVSAGIRGILNFAPTAITVPESVVLSSVDLAVQLEQLSFGVCSNVSDDSPSTAESA
jgi:redox-sensing transcriptional repressor